MELRHAPGVYVLIDANGKKYVGASNDVKKRVQTHKSKGRIAFIQAIALEYCVRDKLPEAERRWIEKFDPELNAYRGTNGSGTTRSEETKRRISCAMAGRKLSLEHRLKISAAKKGVPVHSEERKAAVSKQFKGVPKTEEHTRKATEARRLARQRKLQEQRKQ